MNATSDKPDLRFSDNTPEGADYRAEQAHIDADIEGIARHEDTRALIAEMDRLGLSPEARLARLREHYAANELSTAAE